MKFIHLSDLHVHFNNKDNKELITSLRYIADKYPQHRLIITGDITDDGSPGQYENAYDLLQPFLGRLYFCPGNHDFGASGNLYSRERAQRFDQILSIPLGQGGTFTGDNTPVVNILREGSDLVMLIALDSNLETHSPFDFACGEIGKSQLQSLDTILATAPAGAIKIVFFHHHPFIRNDPFMLLKDSEALARVLYGRTDVVLFGHKHVMGEWTNRWNTQYILASDNSWDKDYAKELTITDGRIEVRTIPIREA